MEKKRFFANKISLIFAAFVLLMTFSVNAGDVPNSPEEVKPLKVGDTAPKLTLKDADGNDFDLNAAIAQQPVILVFYRGGW